MDADSAEGSHEHAVTIWEVNRERLKSMQHKLSDTPKLLRVAAGRSICSIFRVPQRLIDINGKSYQPDIISIGPLHHGQPHLAMMEEHKWRYLGQLLKRTQAKGLDLEHYLKAVQPLEAKARECYSETIPFGTDEFIEMLVLDGCFIIELFLKNNEPNVWFDEFDPLETMWWITSFFLRDLISLENQIPFFVLRCLFDLMNKPREESGPTLETLALGFFSTGRHIPESCLNSPPTIEAKHLLDLLRSTFVPLELEQPTQLNSHPPAHKIHSISKLLRAGIKLKPYNADSFLVVNFKDGIIRMPTILIDDFMSAFLLNAVAFEQCHRCSQHITTYITLFSCLINTTGDVGYLCDWNIIENYLGSDAEIARFFNNIGKDVSIDIDSCYLAGLFADVDRRYRSRWHVQWASFRHTYFNTPWSFISAVAALVLLVFTVAQTIYTILGYFRLP